MHEFDMIIRGGTVATATDTFLADIGINDGVIAALGRNLGTAAREIDAKGKLVLPGGVDSHCHIEQRSSTGLMCADDFYSGTVSAAFGGTTTIIPFAAQHRGQSLADVVKDYHDAAGPKAVIDYAFHLIISDPAKDVLQRELPELIRKGYTSFKVYMTYERLMLNDGQILDVLATARREGALVMIHAENNEVITWLARRLLEQGRTQPVNHTIAHAEIAESEATNRAVSLAMLLDVPLLVVHVSSVGAANAIRHAQSLGLRIYGETCPQYLFLTADDADRQGMDGAKYCCSPPPRDLESQNAMWRGLANGTFQVFSSDHAPYRFDHTGKLPRGAQTPFTELANGVPGIELRLPLLFSEGVKTGRMALGEFVALTSTNHAKMYGLHPRKGTIAVGSDADLAIWAPDLEVTIAASMLHDNVGYTPYEGRKVTGWPVVVISRGRVVVDGQELQVDRGSGEFLPCARPATAIPAGTLASDRPRGMRSLDSLLRG